MLKQKNTNNIGSACDEKIAKIEIDKHLVDEFVHSKVCEELCVQPCAKKYVNSSEFED